MLNISQNNIIRYMTGLSRNSHITTTNLFNIHDLYLYMKLIFIRNLKNNAELKNNTDSFIRDFRSISFYSI